MTTITLAFGCDPREIEAEVVGSIGVHRRFAQPLSPCDELGYFARGYAATHVPTGTRMDTLIAGLETRKDLLAWAKMTQALAPAAWAAFDALPFDPGRFPSHFLDDVQAIRDASKMARDMI